MPKLLCRLPALDRSLGDWLSFLLPEFGREARREWIDARVVTVDGMVADRAGFECLAGAMLCAGGVPDGDWSVLSDASATHWQAWVDVPAWPGGVLPLPKGGRLEFCSAEIRDGLARLTLSGPETTAAVVAERLAAAGMPVVGDLLRGGLGRPGGCVLAGEGEVLAEPFIPGMPAWPGGDDLSSSPATLRVSKEAARALRRGHPWLLPDESSDRSDRFRPGTLLRIESRKAEPLGWGWSEGGGEVSARMAAHGRIDRRALLSVEARIAKALGRRRSLLFPSSSELNKQPTDCFRLVHGEADDLPGFFVDHIGPLLRVLVTSRVCEGFRARALDALAQQLPVNLGGASFSVLELRHLRSPGGRAEVDRVVWHAGGVEAIREALGETEGEEVFAGGFWARENGLRISVDPGWDSPRKTRPGFGLFADQRLNRERLAPFAGAGGRWLNLFAHTGAFSVSLLSQGAGQVESVDLSAAYLKRLEHNLKANADRGVELGRHRSHQGESRRMLEEGATHERFDGIILDPPTAAAAGRRFWSVKKDLEPLIRLCVDRLDSGGLLLVTQNQMGPPLGLEGLLERVAFRAGRIVRSIEAAPPGPDFPDRPGFPEGAAFEGACLILE